jgi:hypothetical protein
LGIPCDRFDGGITLLGAKSISKDMAMPCTVPGRRYQGTRRACVSVCPQVCRKRASVGGRALLKGPRALDLAQQLQHPPLDVRTHGCLLARLVAPAKASKPPHSGRQSSGPSE